MREGIHPNYREVLFVDLSNGFKFVTRSCVNTREMGKTEDGRELPLYKLDTSSESHPFYTGTKNRSTQWVAGSKNSATGLPNPPPSKARLGQRPAAVNEGQPTMRGCPFSLMRIGLSRSFWDVCRSSAAHAR